MEEKGLKAAPHEHLNRWTLARYRDLWARAGDGLERRVYREKRDLSGLPILVRCPSCLKSKADDFDEFMVGEITVLFRRTA